jgi:acyl carrier protein
MVKMGERTEPEFLATLVTVCAELLAVDSVSVAENFFALGGTSIRAVELTEELLTQHGVDLPLDAVFSAETLADLARSCRHAA